MLPPCSIPSYLLRAWGSHAPKPLPVSGPLHFLFMLPRKFCPSISMWLVPLCHFDDPGHSDVASWCPLHCKGCTF